MSLASQLIVRDDASGYEEDARTLAATLLERTVLHAGDARFAIVELELYYSGGAHRDPFAHRDPVQAEDPGRWYFHRSGGSYRGGSFKGLDLTFGRRGTYGGALIRSVASEHGAALVSGPSLVVDRLLAATGHASVKSLDQAIAGRRALDGDPPLRLADAPARDVRVYRSARVGLTLKRFDPDGETRDMPRFLLRPDRFLTEPKRIKKGRAALILARHLEGASVDDITRETGSARAHVHALIDTYEAQDPGTSVLAYRGRSLGRPELAQLHRILLPPPRG